MHGWAAVMALLSATMQQEAPALELESTLRSGYAIVHAKPQGKDALLPKQIEWVVTTDSQEEITYDTISPTAVVVTLPRSGVVTVHAVALRADGSLAPAIRLDLKASATGSAGVPSVGDAAGGLRITVVVGREPLPREQDLLLRSDLVHDRLAQRGHRYLYAYFGNVDFQHAWANTPEDVKRQLATPFLFVQNAKREFVAGYPLHLSDNPRANEDAVLALFPEK